jgi:hypothetical protein
MWVLIRMLKKHFDGLGFYDFFVLFLVFLSFFFLECVEQSCSICNEKRSFG